MRKKNRRMTALLLAVFMMLPLVGTESLMARAAGTEVSAIPCRKATIATVTVSKADEETATKLHAALTGSGKGKELRLKVKGGPKAAYKKLWALEKILQKVNKHGVLVYANQTGKKGGYTYYQVTEDDVKLYKLSMKFIGKIYRDFRNGYGKVSDEVLAAYQQDIDTYSDDEIRKMHIYYDLFVRWIKENPGRAFYMCNKKVETPEVVTVEGGDAPTTAIVSLVNDMGLISKQLIYNVIPFVKEATVDGQGNGVLRLLSFEEFSQLEHIKVKVVGCSCWGQFFSPTEPWKNATSPKAYEKEGAFLLMPERQRRTIMLAPNFSDLSDAMKVWVIGKSDYFSCSFTRPPYGMLYSATPCFAGGSKGMELLYKNKAAGVCAHYAGFESQVFGVLGITCYMQTSAWMSHAWTVVKVKNSKGKTLWIPFDYGIGPAEKLMTLSDSVREALSTEAKRYKVYLDGIKGAPKKKNFKDSDFN